MTRIGIFYGSSTSNTEYAAYELQEIISNHRVGTADVHNIGRFKADDIAAYDYLIFGIPTWDIGELQDDWDVFWSQLTSINFANKRVALFGLGDQYGYPDTFQDAMGILAEEILNLGGHLVGYWPVTGYEFEDSLALTLDRDQFLGLPLDEDNQHELTLDRLGKWAIQVLTEFDLLKHAVA